ncbi:hypothetical protein EI94DRAFT_646661 [Lactarius quietus]|nr:hypothetical protein EI94DRAFT_646661 [Lactarius quietus]
MPLHLASRSGSAEIVQVLVEHGAGEISRDGNRDYRDVQSTFVQYDPTADPVCDLNNYLQAHPSGCLTPHLSWAISQEGPNHQFTYYATAKLQGATIGHGAGLTTGLAKREAAIIALQWLTANGN